MFILSGVSDLSTTTYFIKFMQTPDGFANQPSSTNQQGTLGFEFDLATREQ